MRSSHTVRGEVAECARALHARGWVANHDGNVTARDGALVVATPTATSKRLVGERGLVEVDLAGKPQAGARVFGEIGLHVVVYERRPDVGAVVHAHPPHATAIACAAGANLIERPFLAEAAVSLGPIVPRTAPAAPGDPAKQALAPWCEHVDAVLLGGHGVIAWGRDCEQALLRLELVEHLATIALAAIPAGGVVPLAPDVWPALMQARARAGIGRAADRAVEIATKFATTSAAPTAPPKAVVACAPAPHANVPVVAIGRKPDKPGADLASIVREEIVRALKDA
jgi:L-fuculose-phosphate aldolase